MVLSGGVMRKFLVFAFLLSGMLYLGSCGLSEDTVAKVGGKSISAEEFKQQLSRRYSQRTSYADVDSLGKVNILNNMILQELKASAARSAGLDKDEAFVSELKMQKSRILGNRYFERVIVDKMFPEEELRAEFDKSKEEVKASHVLIAYKGAQRSSATRTKDEAQKLASDISKRSQKGEDIGKLAEKYSDDGSAKQNRGDLGYFTWGRMVGAFQEVAFAMEIGSVSDPVETPFGFHVIKVLDHRESPNFKAENYEKEKINIKRKLYFTKKDTGMAMWNRHSESVREKYGYSADQESIAKVVEVAKTNTVKLDMDTFSEEDKNLVLAKWSGGKLALKDVFAFYGKRFNALAPRLGTLETFEKEVENAALQDLIILDAQKTGIADEIDVAVQITDMENSKLATLIEKQEVTDKADPTEEEMLAHYQEHSAEYVNPEELELWEIYVTKEGLAKSIAKKARSGQNFEKLAKKYSEDKYYKNKSGYLGYKQLKRRGEVSKKAFELGPNKVGGPITYRSGWAIFKTGKLKEKTIRSFEDSQTQIKNKLRTTKMKELRTSWEATMRKKYSVKINTDLVEKI